MEFPPPTEEKCISAPFFGYKFEKLKAFECFPFKINFLSPFSLILPSQIELWYFPSASEFLEKKLISAGLQLKFFLMQFFWNF